MKKSIKSIINIVLTVLFVSLIGLYVTGLHAHEMLGKITGILFLTHLILASGWIKSVTKRFFSKNLPNRVRFDYIINLLIFVGFITVMLTGSRINDMNQLSETFISTRAFHMGVTYITLGLIGIHIGPHMNMISSMFKRFIRPSKKLNQTLTIIAVIICLSVGVFGLIKLDYFNLANPFTSTETIEVATGEVDNNRYPVEKRNKGMERLLYGFLSMNFFAAGTFAIDRFIMKNRNNKKTLVL